MSQTQLVRKASLAILRSLPQSEVVRTVVTALRSGDDSRIPPLRIDPRVYLDSDLFGVDYLAANMVRKWSGLNTGINTEEIARLGFLEQEAHNRDFNNGKNHLPSDAARAARANGIILMASRKIAEVLGRFDPLEFASSCSFSSDRKSVV